MPRHPMVRHRRSSSHWRKRRGKQKYVVGFLLLLIAAAIGIGLVAVASITEDRQIVVPGS